MTASIVHHFSTLVLLHYLGVLSRVSRIKLCAVCTTDYERRKQTDVLIKRIKLHRSLPVQARGRHDACVPADISDSELRNHDFRSEHIYTVQQTDDKIIQKVLKMKINWRMFYPQLHPFSLFVLKHATNACAFIYIVNASWRMSRLRVSSLNRFTESHE